MEDLDVFTETAAADIDLTPVLDFLQEMSLRDSMRLALLGFLCGVMLVIIFTGGWGNG